jgi:hypothetical protein
METDITFNCGGLEMLRLCANGDIFVRENIAAHDIEVVEAFKAWLKKADTSIGSSIVSHQAVAVRKRNA